MITGSKQGDVAKVLKEIVTTKGNGENIVEDTARYRIREDEPPTKKGVGYKVFVLKDGKLYPPMVANPNGEDNVTSKNEKLKAKTLPPSNPPVSQMWKQVLSLPIFPLTKNYHQSRLSRFFVGG